MFILPFLFGMILDIAGKKIMCIFAQNLD